MYVLSVVRAIVWSSEVLSHVYVLRSVSYVNSGVGVHMFSAVMLSKVAEVVTRVTYIRAGVLFGSRAVH